MVLRGEPHDLLKRKIISDCNEFSSEEQQKLWSSLPKIRVSNIIRVWLEDNNYTDFIKATTEVTSGGQEIWRLVPLWEWDHYIRRRGISNST